jgi:hypothetical protein
LNNKSFSDEEISGLIQELEHNFSEYEDKADIFISHCNEFKDNDSYQGTNAVAAKIIVGEKEVEIANLQKELHTKLLDMYKHAAQSFADKVDSAPNARLDLDTLTISENGLKSIYGKMDDYCCKFENIAKEMQNKYGHIGTITVPDCNPLRESMINLCGGDVDNAGFLYELKQKLINFDEEECAYIDNLSFENKLGILNAKIGLISNSLDNMTTNSVTKDGIPINVKELKTYLELTDEEYQQLIEQFGYREEDLEYIKIRYPYLLNSLFAANRWSNLDIQNVQNAIQEKLNERVSLEKWLKLYYGPTYGTKYRTVNLINNGNPYAWYSFEHPYSSSSKYINPQGFQQMINRGEDVNVVINDYNYLTDESGRYWVAVGPKFLDEDYPDNGKVLADDFVYGTKFDVIVMDEKSNIEYYIPCILGDVKNHTYPNGQYHTGEPYPQSTDKSTASADYSYIEFISSVEPKDKENNLLSNLNYKIVGAIIYE